MVISGQEMQYRGGKFGMRVQLYAIQLSILLWYWEFNLLHMRTHQKIPGYWFWIKNIYIDICRITTDMKVTQKNIFHYTAAVLGWT